MDINKSIELIEWILYFNEFRILIIDWDVHHGNGIQRMFEEDPRVLYVSLHRLDIFPLKPEESDCNVTGTGSGAGYTVNIAWPKVRYAKTQTGLSGLSNVFDVC